MTIPCYITQTGSFLPGEAIENDRINQYLGSLNGEAETQQRVLAMNGIVRRHYAQDCHQRATYNVYELATEAATVCMQNASIAEPITFLSAGTTYAPLAGPGIASLVHHRLRAAGVIDQPIEISSHSGICSSAAAALVGAVRAITSGEHRSALCIGTEHASEVLKSSVIQPIDDRSLHEDIRSSQWFMSVFLRFMLSDGAGAICLQASPSQNRLSLRVDWTHSLSFAHDAPLCMKLDNASRLLSQDVRILSRYLFKYAGEFVGHAMLAHGERLDHYRVILPHMSSFFFRRKLERMIGERCADPSNAVPYWTNLETAGNTGAASIFVMLDHYLKQHSLTHGDRLLLFIPESGQFNFVLVSLTAVL